MSKTYVIIAPYQQECSAKVQGFLIDFLCEGRTLIITRSFQTRGLWTAQIMRHLGINPLSIDAKADTKLRNFMDEHICYLNFYEKNTDVESILSKKIDAIVLEEAWALTSGASVSCWLTRIKNVNEDCRLFICAYSDSNFFESRVDSRFLPLNFVRQAQMEEVIAGEEHPKEDDIPPTINIHLYQKNISGTSEINNATLRPYLNSSAKIFRPVDCDSFLDAVLSEEPFIDSYRCFNSLPKIIDLLSQSMNMLTTAMVFNPTPTYGRRLTSLRKQLNDIFDRQSISTIESLYSLFNGDTSKNVIFCSKGKADFPSIRKLSNIFIKDLFGERTIEYSENWIVNCKFGTLCIDRPEYVPPKESLKACRNIFILGDRRFSEPFLMELISRITNDVEIVIPCVTKTADESNVIKALSGLDNRLFNVIKHDLSS